MKAKIIYKSTGAMKMDKTTHVYGLDMMTGRVTKADLMPLDKTDGCFTYRLIEKSNHLYLPASSLEYAQREFDVMLSNAKNGNVKLSFKEWLNKWWTVLVIKLKRLWKFKG